MGVAVDQAGDGHHSGAVDNGLGLLRGSFLFNRQDLAVLNGNICPEQNIHSGIHGHNSDIGNQSIQT